MNKFHPRFTTVNREIMAKKIAFFFVIFFLSGAVESRNSRLLFSIIKIKKQNWIIMSPFKIRQSSN